MPTPPRALTTPTANVGPVKSSGVRLRWEDATTTDGKTVGPLDCERHFCKKCETPKGLRRKSEYRRLRHRCESRWKRSPDRQGFMTAVQRHLLSCSTQVCEVTTPCFHAHTDRHTRICCCRSLRTCSRPWPFWYKISDLEMFFLPPSLSHSYVRLYDFPVLSACEHTTGKTVGPLDCERHFCKKCETPKGLRRKSEYRRLRHRCESSWTRSRDRQGFLTAV